MAELEVGCKRPPVYYSVVTVQTAARQDGYCYNPCTQKNSYGSSNDKAFCR